MGYEPGSLKYATRGDYALTQWGSRDDVNCALRKTRAKCFKPNGRRKRWLTFDRGGYGEFAITKFALFSVTQTVASNDTTTLTGDTTGSTSPTFGDGSTSTSLVERYFAVRALSFRVRGAFKIVITFEGVIRQVVS